MKAPKVLFVCTGNICRSPTAEGVARLLAKQAGVAIEFDSAGIEAYHSGEAPDPRSIAAAARRGYDLKKLRARAVAAADYLEFDYLLAMDRSHLRALQRSCPSDQWHKIQLFLSYAEYSFGDEVPDPYYGGPAGFEHVLDMVEDAARGLIKSLAQR